MSLEGRGTHERSKGDLVLLAMQELEDVLPEESGRSEIFI